MTSEPLRARAGARAAAELRQAIAEAKLAYEFAPNSYTHSCLSAGLAAEAALAVLISNLEATDGYTS